MPDTITQDTPIKFAVGRRTTNRLQCAGETRGGCAFEIDVPVHRQLCAWCGKVLGVVLNTSGDSHGICKDCAKEQMEGE